MLKVQFSPRLITIRPNEYSSLSLKPTEPAKPLSGVSKKEIYQDSAGVNYYLKEAKPRKIDTVFHNDRFFADLKRKRAILVGAGAFNPYTEQPDGEEALVNIEALSEDKSIEYARIQTDIEKYVTHVQELMISNSALELLASQICAGIMVDLLVVPRSYLFVHEKKPVTLSRSVGTLREFLSEHPLLSAAEKPEYWASHEPPLFKQLALTEQQARILGQAYFVALLLGHNDLVNNINLSNCGDVETEDGIKLSIVDWGNVLGVGFSGLTDEEGAFSNPQFAEPSSDLERFTHQRADITSYKHMIPFDEVVYPLLPRQVVFDLFDLTNNDVPALRKAQRDGFYEACDRASKYLGHVHELIHTILQETLQNKISLDDAALIKRLLPEFVYPTVKKNGYDLAAIIEGRIKSLQQMKNDLEKGRSIHEIAQERFALIQKSQELPSARFFSAQRGEDIAIKGCVSRLVLT